MKTFRRILYPVMAAAIILIGANWWMRSRERAIPVDMSPGMHRSEVIEAATPDGDLPAPPDQLRWKPVPGATRYSVQILDDEAAQLWSAETSEPHVALPRDAIAHFEPGKTLLWTVTAYRGNEELTNSVTQTVRVRP